MNNKYKYSFSRYESEIKDFFKGRVYFYFLLSLEDFSRYNKCFQTVLKLLSESVTRPGEKPVQKIWKNSAWPSRNEKKGPGELLKNSSLKIKES